MAQLITFLVAIGTLAVAYNQYRVSRDALRLSLFEKRLAIYHKTTQLLSAVAWDDLDPGHHASFQGVIEEARFLFAPEVPEHLASLFRRTHQYLHRRSDIAKQGGAGTESENMALSALRDTICREEQQLSDLFMPYLGFKTRA